MKKAIFGVVLFLASLLACNSPSIDQKVKDEKIANYLIELKRQKELEMMERTYASLYYSNNNPFNIRVNNRNRWIGKAPSRGPFEAFTSLDHGIRAGIKLLINYQNDYGLKTIEQIIYKFAPPFENNTEEYVRWVSEKTGIPRDQPIDLLYQNTMVLVCKYMIEKEMGKPIAHKRVEQVYSKYFT